MSNTFFSQRRIETRVSNKTAHPGNTVKAPKHQSKAKVQHEREAKAEAKAARSEARQQSINRAAEFELADMANKDLVDATPHPVFTPRQRRNQIQSDVSPITEKSDTHKSDSEMSESPFLPPPAPNQSSDSGDDLTAESDVPTGRRLKGELKKPVPATKSAATKKAGAKHVGKQKKVVESDAEIVGTSAKSKSSQESRPKRWKLRTWNEIDVAAKKIEETLNKSQGKRYGNVVKSTSGTQGDERAPQGSSRQASVEGRKKVQKEGAIDTTMASVKTSGKVTASVTQAEPDQASAKQNDLHPVPTNTSPKPEPKPEPELEPAPELQSPSCVTAATSSRSKSVVPPLRNSPGDVSTPSVLTNDVNIVSHGSTVLTKQKAKVAAKRWLKSTVFSDGGLSDADKVKGGEWEAAIKSPPKGKRRVTSEQLVGPKTVSGPVSKKARYEGLPDWIDAQWFRHTFVSTYMAFIGQTANPWDVPIKQAIKVMQKIWNETNGNDYMIMPTSMVCQKTIQRLADLWQNVVGSATISNALSFCDSQETLRDLDSKRQELARFYLKDLHFMYKEASHKDRKKWRGLFCGPLVLQTFSVHLTAIEGCLKISGLHGQDTPSPPPIGALGLAAAAVERALTLVATGTVTIEMARAARGKSVALPRTLNLSTGKDSTYQTGFSEAAWGKATCGYAKSACSLTKVKFDQVISDAQEFVKHTRTRSKTVKGEEAANNDNDNDDVRGCLTDHSGRYHSDCVIWWSLVT
ncbi:hypothetical protein BJY52DRAFT_1221525 [Lactarius psammicola]|nr:hypothetical protein BJY52DRAFT_1221525 [Lactarius psammicola]